MLNDWVSEAALYDGLAPKADADADAVILHTPTPVMAPVAVPVVAPTVHGPDAVKLTGCDAVALTRNVLPYCTFGNCAKLIVCDCVLESCRQDRECSRHRIGCVVEGWIAGLRQVRARLRRGNGAVSCAAEGHAGRGNAACAVGNRPDRLAAGEMEQDPVVLSALKLTCNPFGVLFDSAVA